MEPGGKMIKESLGKCISNIICIASCIMAEVEKEPNNLPKVESYELRKF